MANYYQELLSRLQDKFADTLLKADIARREVTIEVSSNQLFLTCQTLRDEFGFEQLMDVCGVDYVAYGQADWETTHATSTGFSRGVDKAIHTEKQALPRFAVVYHLLSIQHNQRLRVRALIAEDPPRIDSVIAIWNSA
ncbi:MAG: NADH-quinone oxidoreductase subunit C, partial [Beggiatoa sp. IS2]